MSKGKVVTMTQEQLDSLLSQAANKAVADVSGGRILDGVVEDGALVVTLPLQVKPRAYTSKAGKAGENWGESGWGSLPVGSTGYRLKYTITRARQ